MVYIHICDGVTNSNSETVKLIKLLDKSYCIEKVLADLKKTKKQDL